MKLPTNGKKRLNIGCGTDIKKEWINLDKAAIPGVDIIHDIEALPLPFPDNEFDVIRARDILEHLEYIPVLKDFYRILKPGGTLTIQVPHFTSRNNYIDPTHRKLFSVSTFDFFVRGSPRNKERAYYFDFAFNSIESRRIVFNRKLPLFFYNRIISPLINSRFAAQELYEATMLARLFPAQDILITLKK